MSTIRTAAVLGTGIMGRQMAGLLAGAGLTVLFFGRSSRSTDDGLKRMRSDKPSAFYREEDLLRIIPCTYDGDAAKLAQADLIIEAIKEDPAEKIAMFAWAETHSAPHAIIGTITSGLPLSLIARQLRPETKERFLVIHPFNPPRVLPFLELVTLPETLPSVVQTVHRFCADRLGRKVVMGKDTPCFIGNRIGMYAIMRALLEVTEGRLTFEEIEALTGPLVGRPGSATFRTADLVGLKTLASVSGHLYKMLTHDERRNVFKTPAFIHTMIGRGDVGAEVGRGFSAKIKGTIMYLDLNTLEYVPAKEPQLGDLSAIKRLPSAIQRIGALLKEEGKAGAFVRSYMLDLLNYCATRIPEITDDPAAVDTALIHGFGWEAGPFQIWDGLGASEIAAAMKASGLTVPAWVEEKISRGEPLSGAASAKVSPLVLTSDPAANLIDLGDGVLRFEMRSKANTLSLGVIAALERALDTLEADAWTGMVIGNPASGEFSAGANLAEIGGAVLAGRFNDVEELLKRFQALLTRMYSFEKPLVGLMKGTALGGGAELSIALPHMAAHPNSWVGLVELGVGVIPAGCGSTHLAWWAANKAKSQTLVDIMPFLRLAFERIAMASVTRSAQEAIDFGFIAPGARIVADPDKLLDAAKAEVLRFAEGGYTPRAPRAPFAVVGEEGRAVLEVGVTNLLRGGFISEYDAHLGRTLAYVMTGGPLTSLSVVPQDYLFELERDAFMSLLAQPKTQERIRHFLTTKKPLRN